MEIKKTKEISSGDSIVMCVYGLPKVGKTSFAASTSKFGKTLVFDFENGTKYLGERGVDCDVINMVDWFSEDESRSMRELVDPYDFIVVDPVGEAMDFLITGNKIVGSKFRQKERGLTIAGWGEAKNKLKAFIKFLRSSGKTILLVFHDDKRVIDEEMTHSLMVATKIKEVIPGMVDVISYLAVVKRDEVVSRVLYTPAQGGNYDSGDRTGRVPETIKISEDNGWGDFIDSLKPLPVLDAADVNGTVEDTPEEEEAIKELKKSESELDEALEISNGEK